MSETSKRTSDTCKQENVNLQLRAGGLQYLIAQNTKDLALLNDQMRDLATEFHKLRQQEDYEAKVRADAEAKAATRNLTNEAKQATTQSGSEAAPTPSQPGPDEQSQKKE